MYQSYEKRFHGTEESWNYFIGEIAKGKNANRGEKKVKDRAFRKCLFLDDIEPEKEKEGQSKPEDRTVMKQKR